MLLLQYHSIVTIVCQGQWNALRHGHFAYYSLTTLTRLLGAVGMHVLKAWNFDLYGGTVMVAAVHETAKPDDSVQRILAVENELGITTPGVSSLRCNARLTAALNRCGVGLKSRQTPVAASAPTALRRAQWPYSVARGSTLGSLPPSRTPRPPSRAGECQRPTCQLCRRPNWSRQIRSGALDASRSSTRSQRPVSRASRAVEG